MSKPNVHIISKGKFEQLENPNLDGASGLHVTTGLIVYEHDGEKKGMVIDPGMIYDWYNWSNDLDKYSLNVENISHVLATHFHQDHVQALAKLADKTIVVHYGSASMLGTPEYHSTIYAGGSILLPGITYKNFSNTHTKKDTIYVIDSENEGKVAFVGDMAFSLFTTLDRDFQKNMDKQVSVDPEKRFNEFKKFFNENNDIQKFVMGHHPEFASRSEMEEYINGWE